jgi:hypothetical protein
VVLVGQTTRWEPKTGTDIGGGCVAKEVFMDGCVQGDCFMMNTCTD